MRQLQRTLPWALLLACPIVGCSQETGPSPSAEATTTTAGEGGSAAPAPTPAPAPAPGRASSGDSPGAAQVYGPRQGPELAWYKDPTVLVQEQELLELEPITNVRPMGEFPNLKTAALEGGPTFVLDVGPHIRRLFTGGPDAPYELHLNLGQSHYFAIRDDWEKQGYPGRNAVYMTSVSLRRPGEEFIWRITKAGEPVGGSCRDLGNEWDTAHHAMYKGVKRLHEWVNEAILPDYENPDYGKRSQESRAAQEQE